MAPRRSLEKLPGRAGVELGLKGARQLAGKSGLTRRPHPPGQQGRRRQKRDSDYLLQLKEKQKLQWFYGVPAGQLRRYVEVSRRRHASTAEELLRQLEQRLDNGGYRPGWGGNPTQGGPVLKPRHLEGKGEEGKRPFL